MAGITIVEAGPERLDDIQPLWEQLNRHHKAVSPHFSEYFEDFNFVDRKKALEAKGRRGELRLFFAEASGQLVGQCIASVMPEGLGEIDSIFVDEQFRDQKIGHSLMQAALQWFEIMGAEKQTVVVVHGNESANAFYARYGFLPRSVCLMKK